MCNLCIFCQWPSFIPKYGNFENRPVSWKPLHVEQELAQFRPLGVELEYMCNFWHFGQWPSFMPKYGNFENCNETNVSDVNEPKFYIGTFGTF